MEVLHVLGILVAGKAAVREGTETSILTAPCMIASPSGKPLRIRTDVHESLRLLLLTDAFVERLVLSCMTDRRLADYIRRLFPPPGTAPVGRRGPHARRIAAGEALGNGNGTAEVYGALLAEIGVELRGERSGSETRSRALCLDLFIRLQRDEETEESGRCARAIAPGADPFPNLGNIVEFVDRHCTENFSLSEIASLFECSPGHFSRRFKEKTGMPLFEYLNRLRIQRACVLLKRTRRSVLDISLEVGYNNSSFFNRYFKKVMNMTPREYRRFING